MGVRGTNAVVPDEERSGKLNLQHLKPVGRFKERYGHSRSISVSAESANTLDVMLN